MTEERSAMPSDEPTSTDSPATTGRHQFAPGEAPEPTRADKNTKRKSALREFVTIAAIALTLSFLVKTFLAQPFSIPSESMESTLDIGDRIIVSKFTPQHSPLHRGDVVVFEQPTSWGPAPEPSENPIKRGVKDVLTWIGVLPAGGHHVVKRVIGLPGDKVECDNACATKGGELKVNGVAINETPYLNKGQAPSLTPFSITVPAGKLWVMGDNRGHSGDSREHDDGTGKTGSVPLDDVTGQVVAIAWPIDRIQSVDAHPSVFAKVPNK